MSSVTNEACLEVNTPFSFGAKTAVRGVAAVFTNCRLFGSRVGVNYLSFLGMLRLFKVTFFSRLVILK